MRDELDSFHEDLNVRVADLLRDLPQYLRDRRGTGDTTVKRVEAGQYPRLERSEFARQRESRPVDTHRRREERDAESASQLDDR
ncbi:MAG: hypothetical protein SV862_10550, partial [Pseudomonadota bacterium]|nr:hypothetical protein [Pseudomonadota bacterium]